MQDGPQGFRTTDRTGGPGTSTAWPSALSVAASWDTDLLYRWAEAMAAEFAAKGANIALGPGIGMARVPTAGRNFEYLCGEDPVLGSAFATAVVKGIQSQGIMANAKHWVNNEIEDQRKSVSADVNERVRMELYYPPFQAAVDAGVLTVMCSYNRINDVYACQNNVTLGELREDLGFNGWVMSDWTATHATAKSVNAGLDSEMPLGLYFSQHALQNALDAGEITMEEINTSVKRILTTMFTIGLFDREPKGDPEADVTSEEHSALAREIAAKSMVLMKNSYVVLPIIKTRFVPGSCMAVIGDEYTVYGNGSGHVDAKYTVTPAQGIAAAMAGTGVDVIYNDGSDIDSAVALATKCGFAVVVVATTSGEGSDRENLSLGGNQDDLVVAVNTALNRAAVIVVNTPGAVLMPWASQVSTLIVGWLPGQEAGNALAGKLLAIS